MRIPGFRRVRGSGRSFAVCGLAGWIFLSAATAATPNSTEVYRLFEKYCYDCHSDGARKGGVELDAWLKTSLTQNHREWTKAWDIIRQEFMPPVGADRPSAQERKAITQWIEQQTLGVNYQKPDPGRVTVRRLNRIEYEYSVTDLFGTEITAASDITSMDISPTSAASDLRLRDRLPPDDTAFGFDNNGDFMTVSPALLEKFFSIAEYVVERVLVVDGPKHPNLNLTAGVPSKTRDATTKQVEQRRTFDAKHSGPYQLDLAFTVGDFAAIAGRFNVQIVVDDKVLVQDEVEVGGNHTHKYSHTFDLQRGPHTWAFVTTPTKAGARGTNNFLDPRVHAELTGPIGTGVYEYPESHRRVFFEGDAPKEAKKRRAYARAIVQRVADRAFRRPADAATLDRLTDLVMRNPSFERGVAQALTAILSSPRFLFRAELQPRPNDPKSIHPLDEYALASRLSYLLWLSLPDDELTRLAAQGKLRDNLKAQVDRMLADPKSGRFFEDFPGQWLRTRNVLMTSISRGDGPLNRVRVSMKRETELLFEHIARNDRDLVELITADYTFVDEKLADYYGLKDFSGTGFQKVPLAKETHRGGLLTHGSFLVSTSNPNRTSPVKRGLYVLESLWATHPPPPPPNVPALDDAKADGMAPKTVREQLALHREDKSCAACHAHFDPIGVALENYDILGRWRERENGEKIDPRETTITGETLTGIDDLKQLFAARPEKLYRGITEKFLTYALGRGLETFDAVTVDRITEQVTASKGKFSTLLMGVIESPAFQNRRGDDGEIREAPKMALPTPPPPEQRVPRRRGGAPLNVAGDTLRGTNASPPSAANPDQSPIQ